VAREGKQKGGVRAKGSGWQARWYESATGKVRSQTFPTKAQAERHVAKMKTAQHDGTYVDPAAGKQTLATWWATYVANAAHLRPATIAAYTGAMERNVLPYLGRRSLVSLQPADFETWAGQLRSAGVSVGTIHLAYRVVRLVLERAVKAGKLVRNPAANLRLKVSDRNGDRMRILDPGEIVELAAAVPDEQGRFRALIPFLAYTGLRIGEAAALRLANLNLAQREVRVVEAVSVVGGRVHVGQTKTGHGRVVSLPRLVVAELQRHLAEYPPKGELVFGTAQGTYLNRHNFMNRVWRPALERTGFSQPWPRVHDLRHTAVSLAIRAGATPREAMELAGHSSITVTMNVYGHLFPGQGLALADRLDQLAQAWPTRPSTAQLVELKSASEQGI
jgi:integrase